MFLLLIMFFILIILFLSIISYFIIIIIIFKLGKLYRNGKDRLGRPIIYMRPGKDNTGASEKDVKIRYLIYLLEKCIKSLDESKGEEKLAWVVDYKNYR